MSSDQERTSLTMTLYIITLLFLCNLVVSLNPAPNAQGTASKQLSKLLPAVFSMTEHPSNGYRFFH